MFRRLAAVVVFAVCFFVSATCFADPADAPATVANVYVPPVITPLNKGQPAPFAGVLLTPEAVAKIVADAQECPQRIQVESDHATAVQKAKDDKVLADAQADATRDKAVLQAASDAKDAQIKTLTDSLQKSESARSDTWLYVAGGTLAGALLTAGVIAIAGLAH